MRNRQSRVCVKCKEEKPYEQFPYDKRSHAPTKSCNLCYTPRQFRKHKPPPPTMAPKPCEQCGKTYICNKPPSAMKTRRFCSHECAVHSFRIKKKTCQTCHRELSYEAFSFEPSAKGRRRTCESCERERARLREQQLGFMQSIGRMRLVAVVSAKRNNLPYTLTEETVQAIYKSPCALCGQPSCSLRRIYPELGWLDENVEGTCWLCSQLGTTKTGVLTDEIILKHARAIVAHAEATKDP